MSDKTKTFKAAVILLNIILVVCILGIVALVVQAFGAPLNISLDEVNNMLGLQQGFVEQLTSFQRVLISMLVLPVSILWFIIFYLLRSIFVDMSKGLRFELSHVKKIRWMAIVIALEGLIEMVMPFLTSIILNTHSFIIEPFNEKFLWALMIIALAEIFAYGVDLQTDSDMTV